MISESLSSKGIAYEDAAEKGGIEKWRPSRVWKGDPCFRYLKPVFTRHGRYWLFCSLELTYSK